MEIFDPLPGHLVGVIEIFLFSWLNSHS